MSKNVDIEKLAAGMQFAKWRKKPLRYSLHVGEINDMPPFSYMFSREEQRVETITSSGLETTNTAHKGDFIFSGPSLEKYVLTPKKLLANYDLEGITGGSRVAVVKPVQRMVAKYEGKTDVLFKAPWGEMMVMKPHDYLVRESDGSGFYRIARKEFKETYQRA